MEKDLKLSKVIEICNDIIDGKYKTQEEMAKVLDAIKIINYIPLLEKYEILLNILYAPSYFEEGIEQKSMYLETAKLWQGLFSYTNVDTKSESYLKTIQNYDLIMSVIGDVLVSACKNDYDRLCSMVDTCISFEHVVSLSEKLTDIDVNKLEKYTNDTQKLIDYIQTNKADLEILYKIAEFNDPLLKDVRDEIKKSAEHTINNE